jgi:uncharacterized membrane protein YfcA
VESLSILDIVVALVAVAVSAAIQGVIGFAFGLIAASVIALIEPSALPATLLLLALPLGIWMALRESKAIDVPGFAQMTAGRIAGTVVGAWLLIEVPEDKLALLLGGSILAAVLISVVASDFEAGPRSRVAAGGISGLMGTVGGMGGPAMALAYQKRSGAELRATIAASVIVGSIFSLGALLVAGRLHAWHFTLALILLPAEIIGLMASTRLIQGVDKGWLRPAVLAFAAVGGATVVIEAL